MFRVIVVTPLTLLVATIVTNFCYQVSDISLLLWFNRLLQYTVFWMIIHVCRGIAWITDSKGQQYEYFK